jgi:hypothetical protein
VAVSARGHVIFMSLRTDELELAAQPCLDRAEVDLALALGAMAVAH